MVGIGASAGGLEALREFFSTIPEDPGMGFVVVMHRHPGHENLLPKLLAEVSSIPVIPAQDGALVERGCIYVAPPGGTLVIADRILRRAEPSCEESARLPIDAFFRSLAQDQRERAICIILSGTGTDGTMGLKAIKAENGMAMVQDARSAHFAGMPSSAAATGMADYVLAPAAMARQLMAYGKGASRTALPEQSLAAEEALQRIFQLLRTRTGHDFSGYKTTSVRRRVERRLNVHGFTGPDQYLDFLQNNPHEVDILFKELLISVTSFFRDPEAFELLAAGPLPDLLQSRPPDHTFRVWVPGCATGEEVYSLAILLREVMARLQIPMDAQLFGTDLDADAIEAARAGLYTEGIVADVSPERLEAFFQREDAGCWRIRKEVRQMCIFASHNVIKDAPFTKIDLVSCRNLLIYMDAGLQRRLLPLFHYALKPGGLLLLGPSESVGTSHLFEALSGKWKLFRRCEFPPGVRLLPDLPMNVPVGDAQVRGREGLGSGANPGTVTALIERALLSWYCPAAVVINDRGDIVHIHGRTGAFLEPAAGQPRMNLLEMAREGLQRELFFCLRQIGRERKSEVIREHVPIKSNGDTTFVTLTVARIQEPETLRGLLVVTFRPLPPPAVTVERRELEQAAPGQMEQLESELLVTKESLQTTVEELETSNEELKCTNEVLKSTNEELQSTNEELETSREEMQSLNEELITLNAELQDKVEALAEANDDMQNLLNSTDIATIFLDNHLHIKRYTEQAKNLIKLIPTDVGRPIGDLVSSLDYENLEEDCRKVFRSLNSREVEVRTKGDDWYLVRIMPYRTADNVIDGLVITFVDVSQVHRADRRAQAYCEIVSRIVREPLAVLDSLHRVRHCNPAFAALTGVEPGALERQHFFELAGGVWNQPALRQAVEEILPEKGRLDNFEVDTRWSAEGEVRRYLFNAERLPGGEGGEEFVLTIHEIN